MGLSFRQAERAFQEDEEYRKALLSVSLDSQTVDLMKGKAGEAGSREKLEAYLAKVSEVGTEPEAWDIICKGVSSMLERKGLDYPVHEAEVMGLLYADAHRKEKSLFYGEEAHHARIVEAFEANLFRQCFPILSVSCFSDLSLFLRRTVFVLPRRVLASPLYRMSGLRETGKAG